MPLPEGIHHGDFRALSSAIPDDSIDLIFTDPPYDEDSVALYADAARIEAERAAQARERADPDAGDLQRLQAAVDRLAAVL